MSIDNPDLVQREADLLPLHFEKYSDGDSLREWFAMLTTCDALVQGRFDKLSYFGLADREFYFPHNVVDSFQFSDTEGDGEKGEKVKGLNVTSPRVKVQTGQKKF